MPRPAQHLKQVAEKHGTGTGTATIVSLVERGLEAARAKEQEARAAQGKDVRVNPYVTDAGKCPRKTWLSLSNVEETEPLTTDSLVNFAVGHAVEEAFASFFEYQGGEVLREIRVEIPVGETVVSGRADFLIALPHFNSLVELKSTSSRAMGFMLRQGEPGKDDHRRQLNLYLHASHGHASINGVPTADPFGATMPNFPSGYLCYVVKDATRKEPTIHAFQVDYDRGKAELDLAALAHIKWMSDSNLEVPIPVEYKEEFDKKGKPPNFPCNYCGYKSHCFGGKR